MPSMSEVNVSVEKCVEIKGDYVEKQQSCFISVTLKSWSGQKRLDPTTYLVGNMLLKPRSFCSQLEVKFRQKVFFNILYQQHFFALFPTYGIHTGCNQTQNNIMYAVKTSRNRDAGMTQKTNLCSIQTVKHSKLNNKLIALG